MDLDPQQALTALESGINAAGALAIAYSLSTLGAIILLIGGYVVAGLVERWLFSGLGHVRGLDPTLCRFFSRIARYAILLLVAVMVLAQFGIQTASIIAAMGAIGLAIGLALQGTLQNIAAGIMLLVLRPFRIGEYVEVDQVAGTVEEIGLFATKLQQADGVYVLAPNSTLWNQPVRNFSRNPVRRADITVGIGYQDDIDLAQATMLALAKKDGRLVAEPAPVAFVSELGDSAVAITLRYWTPGSAYLSVRADLIRAAKLAFDSKGISIPFPQREVAYRIVAEE